MMATTHGLFGASVGAAAAAVLAPALVPAAAAVGFLAGALPDVDLLWTHRRTTHYPVFAAVAAVPAVGVAAVTGTGAAILGAVVALALAGHALMDVFAGGVGAGPGKTGSDHGVYDHARGRWIRPRRWVRYAGAPEELALAVLVTLPALLLTTGPTRDALAVVLVLSAVFVYVRARGHALPGDDQSAD